MYTLDDLVNDKEFRMNTLYRVINKNGDSVAFKLNPIQKKVLQCTHKRKLILKARQLGMCLDPNTYILKSDYTWVKIKDIKIGDELIAVDEDTKGQGISRKLRKSIVEKKRSKIEDCYKITFDNGKTLICTGKHKWLTRGASTDYNWRYIEGEGTEKLRVGYKIRRIVTDTWTCSSYEDGWIGGMLDGEGSLALKSRLGGSISVSQIDGPVFERLEKYFKLNKYNYRIERDKKPIRETKFGRKAVPKIVLSRVDEIFKLLGVTKPSRFIKIDWWEGKKLPCIRSGNFSTIIKIETAERREVVDLQTSTKTFIAEGYVSHNSTFSVLDMLDDTIWTPNLATGIVSYSLEHAQHIFKRIIGHALDTLDKNLQAGLNIQTRSAREISFGNGSFLRVDTTLRGGTYQNVLVSEFGKTCARSPMKAEEIVTGTLQSLPIDGKLIIESTGEGMDGYFAEYCLEAQRRKNENLTALDYYLLFFPWFEEPGYRIKERVDYDVDLIDYFKKIESECNVKLDAYQKQWYALQCKILGDKVKQEFPSTIIESFLSRSDAYYFAEHVEKAYTEKRCVHTSVYDALEPVYVAMDIGVNDLTVILFFQFVHGEIRMIDMYVDNNKDVDFYAKHLLQDKHYTYHTIFLPHDSVKRDPLDVVNSWERQFRKLFSGTATNFVVLPRTDKQELISYAKIRFKNCVFNVQVVKELLDNLSKYRKRWHEPTGQYLEEPQPHQVPGHYADAFQYLAQAVGFVERGKVTKQDALEKHRMATEARKRMI